MPKLPSNRNTFNPGLLADQIEMAMIVQHIDKHILSAKLGMPLRTLNHKLANGFWTYEEMFNLFRILKMPNEYILMIYGR